MKLRTLLIVLFFIKTASEISVAKAPIKIIWKQNIKLSLNSINKSTTLTIDKDGNCYVLGNTWFTDSTKDILLLKFNPQGDLEWQRTFDNSSHGDDIPMNVCLDKDGNIWICGIAKNKSNNADFLVLKFSPDGIPVTYKLYDDKNHLFDCANDIIADKHGNIYACGYETSPDSGINMLVIKYTQDGAYSWQKRFSTKQLDVANKLILDDSSNVYVCGTVNNGPHSADIIVQKYDPEGHKKWQQIYDGVLSQMDAGQFLSMDDSSNIYVSGFINHANNRADIPFLKFNRNGQLLQETFYNGHISDCGAIHVNANHSNVYLTGGCMDYNIAVNSSFLINLSKGGKQRYSITAPEDVSFMKCLEINGIPFLLGEKNTHPDNTLIPFIAEVDSSSISWAYTDSTVVGLTHIRDVVVDAGSIYFLGDDSSNETGTISIFRYDVIQLEKTQTKKRTTKKNK